MATQYRFSFGPWNIHEGADPFGPTVRPTREFVEKLDIAVKLGFQGIQFHDDDVIPAELPADRAYGEIEHRFVPVEQSTKVETLVEHLQGNSGLTLVFVRTKRGADRLVSRLRRHGVKAEALHGDMSQSSRRRAGFDPADAAAGLHRDPRRDPAVRATLGDPALRRRDRAGRRCLRDDSAPQARARARLRQSRAWLATSAPAGSPRTSSTARSRGLPGWA